MAWEGIAVRRLRFETTLAIVMGSVTLLGIALIGLLRAASI